MPYPYRYIYHNEMYSTTEANFARMFDMSKFNLCPYMPFLIRYFMCQP